MNQNMFSWAMLIISGVGTIAFLVDFIQELKKVIRLKHHECIDTDPILKLQLNTYKNCSVLDVIAFVAYLAISAINGMLLIIQTDIKWLEITCLFLFAPIFAVISFRPFLYNKMHEEQRSWIDKMTAIPSDELMTPSPKFTEKEIAEIKEFYKVTHREPDKKN